MSDHPETSVLISIGRISKAHGIRGEVCLASRVEDSGLVRGSIFLRPAGSAAQPSPVRVVRVRAHHGQLLLTLEGVATRNDAEALRGYEALLPKAAFPDPEDGAVYLHDLPGLTVLRRTESGEELLGTLASVDTPAGQEIWTIRSATGKDILFPAAEAFVLAIDLEAGTALVDPPPGLVELYLEG